MADPPLGLAPEIWPMAGLAQTSLCGFTDAAYAQSAAALFGRQAGKSHCGNDNAPGGALWPAHGTLSRHRSRLCGRQAPRYISAHARPQSLAGARTAQPAACQPADPGCALVGPG